MQCKHIFIIGSKKGQQCSTNTKSEEGLCARHNVATKTYNKAYFSKEEHRNHRIEVCRAYYQNRVDEYKEINKINKQKNWNRTLLNSCKLSDRRKGRDFDLDEDWVKLMLDDQLGNCFICGCTLLLTNGSRLKNQVSIDRVDNKLGHLKGNVILSCLGCNYIKGDRLFEDYTLPRAIEDILQPL